MNDADQSHSGGNVRIVVRIDDSVEFVGIDGWQVVENSARYSVVIAEQYCTRRSYGRDFFGPVAKTDRGRTWHSESIRPLFGKPCIFELRDVAEMAVLNPGQMPYQLGDGVRAIFRPVRKLILRQIVGCLMNDSGDVRIGLYQKFT